MKSLRITQTRCGRICGTLLLAAGFILLALRLGWIPADLFRSIPFIPLAMMILGAFMLVSSIVRGRGKNGADTGAGNCCSR